MLAPFPVVRIEGLLASNGSIVTRFSIDGPKGARIVISCRGRSCPAARIATNAPVARLKRFERRLRAGTRLQVVITQPGRIGKWTRITIRANRAPKRVDRCIAPGRKRPEPCPG